MERERAEAAAKMSKRDRIEKKLLKEEAIAVCYVCNGGEHFENRSDPQDIVFCERCCVAVHSSCYGFDTEEVRGGGRREGNGRLLGGLVCGQPVGLASRRTVGVPGGVSTVPYSIPPAVV